MYLQRSETNEHSNLLTSSSKQSTNNRLYQNAMMQKIKKDKMIIQSEEILKNNLANSRYIL